MFLTCDELCIDPQIAESSPGLASSGVCASGTRLERIVGIEVELRDEAEGKGDHGQEDAELHVEHQVHDARWHLRTRGRGADGPGDRIGGRRGFVRDPS